MGEQRYEELMRQLSDAFSKADQDQDPGRKARDAQIRHEQWLAEREHVIQDILAIMRKHGIEVEALA